MADPLVTTARRVAVGLVVVVAFSTVLAIVFLGGPRASWNAGARERLSDALRTIAYRLVDVREGDLRECLDPWDFTPRSAADGALAPPADPDQLAARHGVTVRWYRDGRLQSLFFYPIAIVAEIIVDPHSDATPSPQVVMVPLEPIDRGTVPNLHGCMNCSAERLQECQLQRIRSLFALHGIDYAAAILSDGSVRYVAVDEL